MLTQWIEDIKATPTKLQERREQLAERRKELTHKARTQLKSASDDSQERLFHFRAGTLERVDAALDRSDEVPVLGRLSRGAHKLVSGRLESLTALPIDEFDTLNARAAIAAVRQLDTRVALAAVRRHEEQNKNRKTVIAAIEARANALITA